MEKKDNNIFQPRRLNDRLVVMKKELELKYNVSFENISYVNFHVILETLKKEHNYYLNLVLESNCAIEGAIQEMDKANKINEEFKFLYSYIFKMRFPEIYKQRKKIKKYIKAQSKILCKNSQIN